MLRMNLLFCWRVFLSERSLEGAREGARVTCLHREGLVCHSCITKKWRELLVKDKLSKAEWGKNAKIWRKTRLGSSVKLKGGYFPLFSSAATNFLTTFWRSRSSSLDPWASSSHFLLAFVGEMFGDASLTGWARVITTLGKTRSRRRHVSSLTPSLPSPLLNIAPLEELGLIMHLFKIRCLLCMAK